MRTGSLSKRLRRGLWLGTWACVLALPCVAAADDLLRWTRDRVGAGTTSEWDRAARELLGERDAVLGGLLDVGSDEKRPVHERGFALQSGARLLATDQRFIQYCAASMTLQGGAPPGTKDSSLIHGWSSVSALRQIGWPCVPVLLHRAARVTLSEFEAVATAWLLRGICGREAALALLASAGAPATESPGVNAVQQHVRRETPLPEPPIPPPPGERR